MSDAKRPLRYIWQLGLDRNIRPIMFAPVGQYKMVVKQAPYDGSFSWQWSVVNTAGYCTIGTGAGLDDLHDAQLEAEDFLYRVLNGNPKFAKEEPKAPATDPMLEEARKQTAALERIVGLLEKLVAGKDNPEVHANVFYCGDGTCAECTVCEQEKAFAIEDRYEAKRKPWWKL